MQESNQSINVITPLPTRGIPCLANYKIEGTNKIVWVRTYLMQTVPRSIKSENEFHRPIEQPEVSLESKVENIIGSVRKMTKKAIRKIKPKLKKVSKSKEGLETSKTDDNKMSDEVQNSPKQPNIKLQSLII